MPLDIPLGTETAGYTVVIDGRTYRPFLVDASGHLQADVRDLPFALRCTTFDQTVAVTTDVDIVTFAAAKRARIIACGLNGCVAGYNDIGLLLYTYDAAGGKAFYSYQYGTTIGFLRDLNNPFVDLGTGFVPNIYHVSRYVSASDWSLRILFAPHARADYGFGVRLSNKTAANRRFYGAVSYELEQ